MPKKILLSDLEEILSTSGQSLSTLKKDLDKELEKVDKDYSATASRVAELRSELSALTLTADAMYDRITSLKRLRTQLV